MARLRSVQCLIRLILWLSWRMFTCVQRPDAEGVHRRAASRRWRCDPGLGAVPNETALCWSGLIMVDTARV